MTQSNTYIGLDVGERRIGIARGDTGVKIAVGLETIQVDGHEVERLKQIIDLERPLAIVIGRPRNQSGETTGQTRAVELFSERLTRLGVPIVFQDESLTSVLAEQQLQCSGKPYTRGDIDARAACLILTDFLETHS